MPNSGIQNIADANGWNLCFAGVVIVFFSLVAISVFIAIVPKILKMLEGVLPEEHVPVAPAKKTVGGEDTACVAAIAYALNKSGRAG